jgi:DNA-binding transcriptional LysR family regulator
MHWSPDGGYRNLTAHLGRLTGSAWYFDVPLDPAEVRSSLDNAVPSDDPLVPREYHPDVIVTHGERPDARAWTQLFVDRLLVVTAPALLAAAPPLRSPLDLLQRPLIHIDWRANEQVTGPTWQRWFAALGLDPGRLPGGIHVNQATLALDLAIAGRGFALVGHAIAEAELASGGLAIALSPPVPTMPYWILLDPEARERPELLALCDWLKSEAEASLAALTAAEL